MGLTGMEISKDLSKIIIRPEIISFGLHDYEYVDEWYFLLCIWG